MQKFILLAALLAFTQAAWKIEDLFSFESEFYDVEMHMTADIGYQTLYTATANAQAGQEAYGLNFYGFYKIYVNQQFGEVYTNSMVLNFYPFYVTAFETIVQWARLDNGQSFFLNIFGQYDIKLGWFYVNVIENAKICNFSFVDAGLDHSAEEILDAMTCGYSEYTVEDFKDTYWKGDLGVEILGLGTSSWYGTQNLFNVNL